MNIFSNNIARIVKMAVNLFNRFCTAITWTTTTQMKMTPGQYRYLVVFTERQDYTEIDIIPIRCQMTSL